jgi:hypothetical protein
MAEASEHRPGYEPSDVDPRLIAILAGGVAFFLAAVPFVLLGVYPQARHEPSGNPVNAAPPPRLQIDPRADLQALGSTETVRLSTYGWIDRARGTVHLPVERAMELTAQRGLPGWPKP